MVGFMKGLGCGCCSQGGGHCVGTPCSTFNPNYFCPATFLVDEFPRTCEFASQSEVCGPWGYRRQLSSSGASCRTDPRIAFSSYFECRRNQWDFPAKKEGTVGAQWRSAKESTFTFTQNSYAIIGYWWFDAATGGFSYWSPSSQVTGYQCHTMNTGLGGPLVQRHWAGPFYTETELTSVNFGSSSYPRYHYEVRLKIRLPNGQTSDVTFVIYNPHDSPFSNLDPEPFVKSFIDLFIDSTITLQWGNSNTVNVTATIDYNGRYFYARSAPPYYTEWLSKTTPETFSGSVTKSTTVSFECNVPLYGVKHPCYTHGITYETYAMAEDQVNGLYPPLFWNPTQTYNLEAIPLRVLRMEATKS